VSDLGHYEQRIRALERKVVDLKKICALSLHLSADDATDIVNEFIFILHETAHYHDRRKDLQSDEDTSYPACRQSPSAIQVSIPATFIAEEYCE